MNASGTTLTQIQGIGFLTAAKILALTGDIRRFPNQEHYASYAGDAPIDVSSGDQQTHRLSRRGNRQLNAAIHVAAVTQARDPGPGRDHYRRKLTEHKTSKRSPPEPETTPVEHHLPSHPGRPRTHSNSRYLTHRGADLLNSRLAFRLRDDWSRTARHGTSDGCVPCVHDVGGGGGHRPEPEAHENRHRVGRCVQPHERVTPLAGKPGPVGDGGAIKALAPPLGQRRAAPHAGKVRAG